jgi:uncharacterized protein
VRFWDASAVVPLLVDQPTTGAVRREFGQDSTLLVWWASRIECASALARLERERSPGPREIAAAFDRLAALTGTWQEIQPTAKVRQGAERLLRVHPLRTGDALQLAAALVAADGEPRTLPFVTLDERLALAARREGFPVVEPDRGRSPDPSAAGRVADVR